MDWLNDKKNQPIIIGVVVALLLGVGAFYYFMLSPKDEGDMGGEDYVAEEPMENPDEGLTEEQPAEQPAQPAANNNQVAAAPGEPSRDDPFLPIGYKPPKAQKKIKLPERLTDFPFAPIPNRYVPGKEKAEKAIKTPEPQQPVRRMAGLMINDRVFAIIETNGESQIVQPGDMLKDRLATVERIESDRVILKTTSKNPRLITVRMAAAPQSETEDFYDAANNASSSSGNSGGAANTRLLRNSGINMNAPGMAGSFPGRM